MIEVLDPVYLCTDNDHTCSETSEPHLLTNHDCTTKGMDNSKQQESSEDSVYFSNTSCNAASGCIDSSASANTKSLSDSTANDKPTENSNDKK